MKLMIFLISSSVSKDIVTDACVVDRNSRSDPAVVPALLAEQVVPQC
jgi:hypothetical protein